MKLSGILLCVIGRLLIDLSLPFGQAGARLLTIGWRWRDRR